MKDQTFYKEDMNRKKITRSFSGHLQNPFLNHAGCRSELDLLLTIATRSEASDVARRPIVLQLCDIRVFVLINRDSLHLFFFLKQQTQILSKEVGPLTAKLALSLINFMKYGIVQFLLYDTCNSRKVQTVYICQTFIINNQFA